MQYRIVIGFSTPKKFHIIPWIIRKVEGTDFSHVYVKWYSSSTDRWIIYQASGLQVNFIGSKLFDLNNITIKEFELELDENTYKELVKFAIDNAGVPYGIKQLIGIAITRLARFFGRRIKNPFPDGELSEVCAELLGRILVYFFGVDIKEDLDTIGPKGIYEYVSKLK